MSPVSSEPEQPCFPIRSFVPEDALAVSKLIHRAEQTTDTKAHSAEQSKWWLSLISPEAVLEKAKDRELWVAVSEMGIILGIIGLKKNHLRTFYVDPDMQGKGIGRALFKLVKNLAIERGYKTIVVHASPFAVPIYQHFGFRKQRTLLVQRDGFQYEETLLYLKLDSG